MRSWEEDRVDDSPKAARRGGGRAVLPVDGLLAEKHTRGRHRLIDLGEERVDRGALGFDAADELVSEAGEALRRNGAGAERSGEHAWRSARGGGEVGGEGRR